MHSVMHSVRQAMLCSVLLAAPLPVHGDGLLLSPEDRAILHAEIRAALLDLPHLLPDPDTARPLPTPLDLEISSDLARIAAHADQIFDPSLAGFGPPDAGRVIALFVGPDCADECRQAEQELRDLTSRHDLRVTLIDISRNPQLAEALGVDITPFIVFPDKFLRGHFPPIVLERYLSE